MQLYPHSFTFVLGFNISTTEDLFPILKLYARGKFQYKFPTENTDNIYVTVTNPLTGEIKVILIELLILHPVQLSIFIIRWPTKQPDKYIVAYCGILPMPITNVTFPIFTVKQEV